MDNCFNFITIPVSPQPAVPSPAPHNKPLCKRPPFALQKVAFYRAICGLLQGERRHIAKHHIITLTVSPNEPPSTGTTRTCPATSSAGL